MAFLNEVGNILKQSASKQFGSQIGSQFLASNPSIYQALRCRSSCKVFVGGLPWKMDDSGLRETFSPYGEVLGAMVAVDRIQCWSRGFGFVTFSSTEEASSVIQAMNGQLFEGRTLKVNYATEKPDSKYGGGDIYGSGDGSYGGGQNYGGGNGGGYGGGNGGDY